VVRDLSLVICSCFQDEYEPRRLGPSQATRNLSHLRAVVAPKGRRHDLAPAAVRVGPAERLRRGARRSGRPVRAVHEHRLAARGIGRAPHSGLAAACILQPRDRQARRRRVRGALRRARVRRRAASRRGWRGGRVVSCVFPALGGFFSGFFARRLCGGRDRRARSWPLPASRWCDRPLWRSRESFTSPECCAGIVSALRPQPGATASRWPAAVVLPPARRTSSSKHWPSSRQRAGGCGTRCGGSGLAISTQLRSGRERCKGPSGGDGSRQQPRPDRVAPGAKHAVREMGPAGPIANACTCPM
jgi:hypothetical protein